MKSILSTLHSQFCSLYTPAATCDCGAVKSDSSEMLPKPPMAQNSVSKDKTESADLASRIQVFVNNTRREWVACDEVYPIGYGTAMSICDEIQEILNAQLTQSSEASHKRVDGVAGSVLHETESSSVSALARESWTLAEIIAIVNNPHLNNAQWSNKEDEIAASFRERIINAFECLAKGQDYRGTFAAIRARIAEQKSEGEG